MKKRPAFHVKKHTLLAIAGCVWLLAGFNVARLGLISSGRLTRISAVHILLSLLVFCAFGFMFAKMSIRHRKLRLPAPFLPGGQEEGCKTRKNLSNDGE